MQMNRSYGAALLLTGATCAVVLLGGCKSTENKPPTEQQLQAAREQSAQNIQNNPNIPPEAKARIQGIMAAHQNGGPPPGATSGPAGK